MKSLRVGAATVDISPQKPQFLFGYPHVERYSSGIHDPIQSNALYLRCESAEGRLTGEAMFIANDIIFVDKQITHEVRTRIQRQTGISPSSIMVSATHTHSAPVIVDYASNRDDPVVPAADPAYRQFLIDSIVRAGVTAAERAVPASLGFGVTQVEGVGTNRRDPHGPADHEVPIVVVRDHNNRPLACMLVYSMHPTVLHQDSTLVSADFPAFARRYLCSRAFGGPIPVIYHTGTAGNQSPRHVTRANTFAEAERLGSLLGEAVQRALPRLTYHSSVHIQVAQELVDLPRRDFPDPGLAQQMRDDAAERLEELRRREAARQEIRTAETDLFGADEVLTLARAARQGVLEPFYQRCLPAEVQVIAVGPHRYVGWAGELFVEYGLELKQRAAGAFGITMANGELQGYVVTEQAAAEGGYEASNALFSWRSGPLLLDAALRALKRVGR